METILGLLLILLPAIFRLVEKRLKASGDADAAGKVHDWTELFGENEEHREDGDENVPSVSEMPETVVPKYKPVQTTPVHPQPIKVKAKKTSSRPMLMEEEPKKKEKIDPKKLVIYSEIMKPKF